MHSMSELRAWDRLLKEILWQQIGLIKNKRILDFGSGEGITANYFAANNSVVAIEPWEDMLKNRWADHPYEQIVGDISILKNYANESFDMVLCHNVMEYIDQKNEIINELSRVLKKGGMLSVAKHNRAGRVMQMAVLLDDFQKANDLLDGKDGISAQFGKIRYYEDDMITKWNPELELSACYGIRSFWDLQQNQEKHLDENWQREMKQLEMRVSQIDDYRRIAFFHHLLFIKQ